MNSRERVLKAVNFQEADHVPIDLGSMGASGISARAYDKLKQRLGIHGSTRIFDVMQVLAVVEPAILARLHADVVPLDFATARWAGQGGVGGVEKRLPDGPRVIFPPGTRITEEADGAWILRGKNGEPVARMPKNGLYFDFIRTTMSERTIDPLKFKPANTIPEEDLEHLARYAKTLYTNTDKAILGWGFGVSFMGLSALLSDNITQGALDEWLCMLMTEKQAATEMMGRYVDASISCLKLIHQAVGDYCFAWGVASDDAGTQRGELIAPDLFAEMIVPHYRRLCDWVHAHTHWKTFLHSCGSIYHYLPPWINAGIDILNPVQTSAVNMEPERLKKEFGGRIVFWGGGCDTQSVLHAETPSEIREHVRKRMEIFKPGGGFVFNQVHNIQANVPPENVLAMFDAAWEYGLY